MMPQEPAYVAVDVSKATLEIGVYRGGRAWRAANRPAGWSKLLGWLAGLGGSVVVGVEPSGGYERGVVKALLAAGVEVRWCDPGRVRALARALGAPAKTDAIDVAMIGAYLAHAGGRAIEPDDEREALKAVLSARRSAQEAAQRLEAQAEALPQGLARDELEALAVSARRSVQALTRQALSAVRATARLQASWRRLQTAPGVGPLVAAELLAHMPELGRVSSKAIAKLAGLAPFIRQSGAWKGKASCSGGRPRPRQVLYMAVLATLRRDPPAYRRLVSAGKPPKLAITACMRRLLVILNAMLKTESDWRSSPT
jgi:transposase